MKLVDKTFPLQKRILLGSKKPLLSPADDNKRIVLSQGVVPWTYACDGFVSRPVQYPIGGLTTAELGLTHPRILVQVDESLSGDISTKDFISNQETVFTSAETTYYADNKLLQIDVRNIGNEWDLFTKESLLGETYLKTNNFHAYDKIKDWYDNVVRKIDGDDLLELRGDYTLFLGHGSGYNNNNYRTNFYLDANIVGTLYNAPTNYKSNLLNSVNLAFNRCPFYYPLYTPILKSGKIVFKFSNIQKSGATNEKYTEYGFHDLCVVTPCVDYYAVQGSDIVSDVADKLVLVKQGTVRGTSCTPKAFVGETFDDQNITVRFDKPSRFYLFVAYLDVSIPSSALLADRFLYGTYTPNEGGPVSLEYIYYKDTEPDPTGGEKTTLGIHLELILKHDIDVIYAGPVNGDPL